MTLELPKNWRTLPSEALHDWLDVLDEDHGNDVWDEIRNREAALSDRRVGQAMGAFPDEEPS